MNYTLIEALPAQDEIARLYSTEMASLTRLWVEKKGELQHSGEYQQFIKKMQRGRFICDIGLAT